MFKIAKKIATGLVLGGLLCFDTTEPALANNVCGGAAPAGWTETFCDDFNGTSLGLS